MSTLTLHIGRSIGATLQPGDEIVVTTLDHEANVSTWRAMAADRGVTVQTVDIDPSDVTLDLEDLESKLGPRTKLVAVGYASNAVGTINPVARDRRPRARGRRADLRRRRRLRAARPDRRPRRSTPTSSPAPPTSGSARTSARCTARPRSSTGCRPTRCARPTTGSRPGPRRSSRSPGTLAATDYLRDVGRELRRRDGRAGRGVAAASGGASSSRRWSRSPATSGSS